MEEISVVKTKPKSWTIIEGATTAPVGTKWIRNGPFFVRTKEGFRKNPNYEQKLLVTDGKIFRQRIKEPSSRYEIVKSRQKHTSKNRKRRRR